MACIYAYMVSCGLAHKLDAYIYIYSVRTKLAINKLLLLQETALSLQYQNMEATYGYYQEAS